MKRREDTDKYPDRSGSDPFGSYLDLEMPDPGELLGELHGALTSREGTALLDAFTAEDIADLLEESRVFARIGEKGYPRPDLVIENLSPMDQRILLLSEGEKLIHFRLKLAYFRLRLMAGTPRIRVLYIDWLETRHLRRHRFDPDRLFPGQSHPGLGIFPSLCTFVRLLAERSGARGALNVPEYFHDALLFHRWFRFYDPEREALFQAVLRDLRREGARAISRAFVEGRITDRRGRKVEWKPGEMLSVGDPLLASAIWSRRYEQVLRKRLNRLRLRIEPPSPGDE